MKTLIIFILLFTVLLIADSVKTDLVVTFKGLTLEQAAKVEEMIKEDFSDYNIEITLPVKTEYEYKNWWGGWYYNNSGTLSSILDTTYTIESKEK